MLIKSSTIYTVGALTGILVTITIYIFNNSFAPVAPYIDIGKIFSHGFISNQGNDITVIKNLHTTYSYKNNVFNLFFIIGMMFGGLFGSKFYKNYKINFTLPNLFLARFGKKLLLRLILSFLGGMIMGFGGVLASGCSIYYGVSAIAQLNITGFITFFFFILGAYLVNKLIYLKDKK